MTANTKLQFKAVKFLDGIKDLNKEDNSGHEVDLLLMADVFAELINAMQNWIVEEINDIILDDNQLKAYEYGLAHHPNLREGYKIYLEKEVLSIELAESNAILEKIFKHDNTKAGLVALLKRMKSKRCEALIFRI